jgi:hypothetical protein
MGNLITALSTIGTPLLTKEIVIPFIMHPTRWGGIPFVPPGPFKYAFLYLTINLLIITIVATLSGMMTTARECRKANIWTAVVNARWTALAALIGFTFLTIFPFTKATALGVLGWLPYANQIVIGLYVAIFVLIGGMIGNGYNRRDVCYPSRR